MRIFVILKAWLKQFLHALTQLINTTIPPLDGTVGWADESVSSRAHRAKTNGAILGFMENVINWIFFWEKDHCKSAYNSEALRRILPPESRSKP